MKTMNRSQLAAHFGVNLSTLDGWIRKGLPFVQKSSKGKQWRFSVDAVKTWRDKQTETTAAPHTSLTDQRIRLTKITADRKELLLQRERGQLIDVERAMTLWGAVIQIFVNKLEAIPVKLAPLARATSTDMEAKEIIEKFINEIREELSNPDLREINKIVADQEKLKHVKTKKPIKRKSVGRPKR